jgi:replication factor A1
MDIKDLKDGTKKVDVEGVVTEIGAEREVNLKAGGTSRVRDVSIKDGSGSITLTLWNEDIDRVSEGSTISIANGYVNSFRGDIKLNVGRYGAMKVDGN